MSLTAFITDKNFQELRDKFKTVFPRPPFVPKTALLAPPMTNNHSIVGQAFDYLLRFLLEHHHKSKVQFRGGWVADSSYQYIYSTIKATTSKKIRVGFRRDIEKNKLSFLKLLVKEYSLAKINYSKFLSTGKITDALIKSALYLARLDVTARSGMIDPNLGNENENDISDMRQLIKILNPECLIVKNHCILNPTFGDGSRLVGGADADIIIDDTLIDIKVTKNLLLEREHLNQTIGYYILSLIGGVNGDHSFKPIKNIAIYFARHGVFWKVALADIADEPAILDFKNWFIRYADQKIWRGQRSTTIVV
jgi:hypothetical protein